VKKEEEEEMQKKIRTIFLGSNGDGLGWRSVSDNGAGQEPNAILRPFLELL
jgi:hypothetical protein